MRAVKRPFLVNRIIPLVIATAALYSCTLTTDPSRPATMEIVSGDVQTAPVNTALPDSLSVIVVGSFFEPIVNEPVVWSIVAPGEGSLDPATSQTNKDGVAWTRYTAGATAGAVKIQVRVSGLASVFFDETVTP